MRVPLYLPVKFSVQPVPLSTREALFLCEQLAKIAPLASVSYKAKDTGSLSMRYPSQFSVIYEVGQNKDRDVVQSLYSLAGAARLSAYDKHIVEGKKESHSFSVQLTEITKNLALVFKKSKNLTTFDYNQMFLLVPHIQSFDKLRSEGSVMSKEQQQKLVSSLDIETQGFLKRKYGA